MSVKCTKFSAWNWSPTMLIGISPKFEYICGKCGNYNKGRFTSNTLAATNLADTLKNVLNQEVEN